MVFVSFEPAQQCQITVFMVRFLQFKKNQPNFLKIVNHFIKFYQ